MPTATVSSFDIIMVWYWTVKESEAVELGPQSLGLWEPAIVTNSYVNNGKDSTVTQLS